LGVSEKPKRSPDWDKGFKHLSAVQRYCSNYIATWSSQAIPVDRIWCDVLFIRSVVAIKSVLVLVHHDAVDDAAIIVRTIFEIEFQLGAIKKDRKIAIQLIGWAEVARLTRLKNRTLPEGMTSEELERKLGEAREFGKKLTKEALAQKADRNQEYRTFYSALSEIAHTSPVGLRHYIAEGDTPGSVRVNPSGSLYRPELVMALASATQLEVLRIIREMRADPRPRITSPPFFSRVSTADGQSNELCGQM
jgi:hypothetical protein